MTANCPLSAPQRQCRNCSVRRRPETCLLYNSVSEMRKRPTWRKFGTNTRPTTKLSKFPLFWQPGTSKNFSNFSQVLAGSRRFLAGFSQVLAGSRRFSQVLAGSRRFSRLLAGSRRFRTHKDGNLGKNGLKLVLWVFFSLRKGFSGILAPVREIPSLSTIYLRHWS